MGINRDVPRMEEVDDTSTTISNLVDLEGNRLLSTNQNISLLNKNLVQDNPFEGKTPDDTDYEGYQGNYAGTVNHWYQRTVMFIIRKDEVDDLLFSAGGLNFAFQKLNNLGAGQPGSFPNTDMRHWVAKIMSKAVRLQMDQAIQLLDLAVQWKDAAMFSNIINLPICGSGTIGEERILKAWRAFLFEIVRPILEMLLARATSLAEKANLIFKMVKPNALVDERKRVLQWCSKECAKVLSSFSTAQAKDVPTVMEIIRLVGLESVRKLMIPNVMKQTDAYPFLIAFIKALREQRQAILAKSSAMQSSLAQPSGSVVEALIAECLSQASKQWSHASQIYHGYNVKAAQTAKVDRIVETLEQALISNNMTLCKDVLVDVLKTSGTSAEDFTQIYSPLVPRLKTLLTSQSQDVRSPPFLSFFQILVGAYLSKVLGGKGKISNKRLSRKIGCGCPNCGQLGQFMTNPQSSTHTFWLAQTYRTHLETRLNSAKDLCTYTTIRSGSPHGLQITKLPEVVQASIWEYRQKQARAFLAAVGSDEVIRQVMGARYPDVVAALYGSAPFGNRVVAGASGTASSQPRGSSALATSSQQTRHVGLTGKKRKGAP